MSGHWAQRGLLSVMVSALLVFAGCNSAEEGPALGEVTGIVTLDGDPLESATVTFTPVDLTTGSSSIATTDESGKYELQYSRSRTGAVVGDHSVRVSTAESGVETVPARYNVNTELEFTVEPGENEHDIPIDSDGEVIQPAEADVGC